MMELMIVVVILGILVAIAIPRYGRAVERAKDKEAVADLYAIMAAEKIYKAREGTYWPNRVAGWDSESDVDIINTELGLDLKNANFTFGVGTGGTSYAAAGAYRWDSNFGVGKFSRSWRVSNRSWAPDEHTPYCEPDNCPVAVCECP